MSETVINNRRGGPVLRLLNSGEFLTYSNKYLGFLQNEAVYDYNGAQRAWFENGVLRDLQGNVIGFVNGASDPPAPLFPIARIPRIPPVPPIPPFRPFTQFQKFKPFKSMSWSAFDPVTIFGVGR